jgi:hypothetical protein
MGYLLTALSTFLGVLYGFLRQDSLNALAVFVVSVYIGAEKVSVFYKMKFLPIVLYVFLFSIFFVYFGANRSGLSYGFDRLTELDYQAASQQQNDDASFSAFDRLAVIAQITNVIDIRERSSDNSLESLEPLYTALIPRFLWPDKPKIALGVWFALKMGAASQTDNWYNNSINMTIPGHLYLAFGFIGLIIGSFLFGQFIRFLFHKSDYVNLFNFGGSIMFGYLIFLSLQGFGADLQIIFTIFSTFLVINYSAKLLNRKKNEGVVYRTNLEG